MLEKQERRRRRTLGEAVASLLEIPPDAVVPMTVCTVRGRRESEAAGCGGIREYGPERVTLAADGGVIVIEGRGLGIEDFTDGAVLVRGEIRSVTFGEEA